MKLIVFILVFLFLTSIFITRAFAHPGGGPPFVKINNYFADTDPYSSDLEDIGPQVYTVGEKLLFTVMPEQLSVPPEIIDKTIFSWVFENTGETKKGKTVEHSYKEPESYYVALNAQVEGDAQPTLLTKIRINVAASKEYQLPKAKMTIEVDSFKTSDPISFSVDPTLDNNSSLTSVEWKFGNGEKATGKRVEQIFKGESFAYLTSVKVTDSEGFITYDAVIVESIKGKLKFSDPSDPNLGVNVIVRDQNAVPTNTRNAVWYVALLLGIGVVLTLVITIIRKIFVKKK